MKCRFASLQVRGIAAAVPTQVLPLASLAPDYGSAEVQRIMDSTGITEVRIAPGSTTAADLCADAARHLLGELRVAPADLDGIVFVSQTPDYLLPATSACLQHRLGLRSDIPAFDLPYGCSGYIYGLFQAALLLQAGACRQVLVCAGDTMARFIHPGDRSVRMVFGDAGSATLVSAGGGSASFTLHTDGSGAPHLIIPAGGCRQPRTAATAVAAREADGNLRSPENIRMSGAEVLAFSLREVPRVIDETLALAGWPKESIGLYGLHQANKFMVDYLARKSRLPPDAVPVGMGRTGNTGPASIPLLLATVRDAFPPARRARSLLCGFGVGFSWGACALDLESTTLLPPLEV